MLNLKLQYFGLLIDMKDWLTGKYPDAGKDWMQEEKGMIEDEMVREHHWLNEQESEQVLGDSEGQGSLDVLQSMGSQRIGHNWVTEQQQEVIKLSKRQSIYIYRTLTFLLSLSLFFFLTFCLWVVYSCLWHLLACKHQHGKTWSQLNEFWCC